MEEARSTMTTKLKKKKKKFQKYGSTRKRAMLDWAQQMKSIMKTVHSHYILF